MPKTFCPKIMVKKTPFVHALFSCSCSTNYFLYIYRDQLNLWSGKCFKVSTQSEFFVYSCYGPLSLCRFLVCFLSLNNFAREILGQEKKRYQVQSWVFVFAIFFYLLTGHIFFLQLSKVTEWTKYVDMLVICVRFFSLYFEPQSVRQLAANWAAESIKVDLSWCWTCSLTVCTGRQTLCSFHSAFRWHQCASRNMVVQLFVHMCVCACIEL